MFACLHAFDSGSDSGQMSLVYLFMRLIVRIIISVFAHSPAPCYHLLANKLSSSRRHYPSGSDGFLLPTHFSGLNHKTMHSKSKMITFMSKCCVRSDTSGQLTLLFAEAEHSCPATILIVNFAVSPVGFLTLKVFN